jgi:hypothetical protein
MKPLLGILAILLIFGCDHEKVRSCQTSTTKNQSIQVDLSPGLNGSSNAPIDSGDTKVTESERLAEISENLLKIDEITYGQNRIKEIQRLLSNLRPDELHLVIPWLDANVDDDEFGEVVPFFFNRNDWSLLKDYAKLHRVISCSKLELLRIHGLTSLGSAMASNLGLDEAAKMITFDFSESSKMLDGLLDSVKGERESLEFLVKHPELPFSTETLISAGKHLADNGTFRQIALSAGASGKIHEKVSQGVYFSWIRDDPLAASEWMSGLQAGNFKDTMIRSTCEYLVFSGQRTEAERWAAVIADPEVRNIVVATIAPSAPSAPSE